MQIRNEMAGTTTELMSQAPHSLRFTSPSSRPSQAFSDSTYLLNIIAFLKRERNNQALSLDAVTRKARMKKGVIDRAERCGIIPTTRDFKAWCAALGLTWEDVWGETLERGRNLHDRQTPHAPRALIGKFHPKPAYFHPHGVHRQAV
ncbi:MAG: hypothetical protein ABI162_03370 [Luteolibacter sp.]